MVFKNKNECDFIVKHGAKPKCALQVCWEMTERNSKREIAGLIEACKSNNRIRFISCYGLVNELIEAREQRDLRRLLRRYSRYDLLICDKC